MNNNVISKTKPVNTKLIIGGMALLFLEPSVEVIQAWEADKMRNYR